MPRRGTSILQRLNEVERWVEEDCEAEQSQSIIKLIIIKDRTLTRTLFNRSSHTGYAQTQKTN